MDLGRGEGHFLGSGLKSSHRGSSQECCDVCNRQSSGRVLHSLGRKGLRRKGCYDTEDGGHARARTGLERLILGVAEPTEAQIVVVAVGRRRLRVGRLVALVVAEAARD